MLSLRKTLHAAVVAGAACLSTSAVADQPVKKTGIQKVDVVPRIEDQLQAIRGTALEKLVASFTRVLQLPQGEKKEVTVPGQVISLDDLRCNSQRLKVDTVVDPDIDSNGTYGLTEYIYNTKNGFVRMPVTHPRVYINSQEQQPHMAIVFNEAIHAAFANCLWQLEIAFEDRSYHKWFKPFSEELSNYGMLSMAYSQRKRPGGAQLLSDAFHASLERIAHGLPFASQENYAAHSFEKIVRHVLRGNPEKLSQLTRCVYISNGCATVDIKNLPIPSILEAWHQHISEKFSKMLVPKGDLTANN